MAKPDIVVAGRQRMRRQINHHEPVDACMSATSAEMAAMGGETCYERWGARRQGRCGALGRR